jgi:hypothetical protein
MPVKHIILMTSLLALSACASQSAINETGYIAEKFCQIDGGYSHGARELYLSPSLQSLMARARLRSGMVFDTPSISQTAPSRQPPTEEIQTGPVDTAPENTSDDLMPPHFDSSLNASSPAPAAEKTPATPVPASSPVCAPGRVFTMNGVRYAEIRHGSQTDDGWTDRLVLKEIDGKWMIDDILFAPDYRRGIRETLIRTP